MEEQSSGSPPAKQAKIEPADSEEQAWQACMVDMYVSQHFQATAEEFTDTVFNLCVQHIVEILPTSKKFLRQLMLDGKDPNDAEHAAEIDAKIDTGIKLFLKSFFSVLEHNSDVMQLYLMKNIIKIPEEVVLPDDVAQLRYQELVKSLQSTSGNSAEEYTKANTTEKLTSEVDALRERLCQAKIRRLRLEQASNKANDVIQKLESLEEVVSPLQNGFPSCLKEFVLRNITLTSNINLPIGLKKTWKNTTEIRQNVFPVNSTIFMLFDRYVHSTPYSQPNI